MTNEEKQKEYARELKRIGDRNRRFNKLDAAGKRVAIARDVIAQLKAGKYIATGGQYIGSNAFNNGDKVVGKVCTVCALGALAISLTNRVKAVSIKTFRRSATSFGEGGDRYSITSVLRKYFSIPQLQLIEDIFENWNNYCGDTALKVEKFMEEYPDEDARLEAIMKNIIRNDGKFIL